jgi:hypothetical protein
VPERAGKCLQAMIAHVQFPSFDLLEKSDGHLIIVIAGRD